MEHIDGIMPLYTWENIKIQYREIVSCARSMNNLAVTEGPLSQCEEGDHIQELRKQGSILDYFAPLSVGAK